MRLVSFKNQIPRQVSTARSLFSILSYLLGQNAGLFPFESESKIRFGRPNH